jgi:hypothetical protein
MTGDELAKLDELRPPGTSRPAFLRSLLREPPRDDEVATRREALSILTSLARDGRVAAAIALEAADQLTTAIEASETVSPTVSRTKAIPMELRSPERT